jgi:protein-disulfide isomerase
MKLRFGFLALALVGAAPPAPNWVGTVALAPNGAYVMGNPKAKVRLVEYVSYTCSHCAHYVGEASAPIKKDYIAPGLVSVEFRNAVRDQFDMTAALAARCGGAGRFFGNTELLLATQDEWLGKAQAFVTANGPRMKKMTPELGYKTILHGVGLDKVMQARGFTVAQLDVCVASKANQNRILGLTKEAWSVAKITGTPSFVVNDVALTDAGTWAIVEGSIKAALGTN